MRLSFREFHMQFDPTLRRERVPEALFELLGRTPSAKAVFEGIPLAAAKKDDEQQEMTDAEQPADAQTAAQPNGTAAPSAEAPPVAADTAAADASTAADGSDALEPVPDIAQQLYAQVLLLYLLLGQHTVNTKHFACVMPLSHPCIAMLERGTL